MKNMYSIAIPIDPVNEQTTELQPKVEARNYDFKKCFLIKANPAYHERFCFTNS